MNTEIEYEKGTPLVDHLFRHETGRLTSVLTRIFGSHNLELAEGVVQDSFLEAIKVWNFNGVPENSTAKNNIIVNRECCFGKFIFRNRNTRRSVANDVYLLPPISSDSQVSLTLKTLCGFSIPKIAKAFLTSDENINKRLVRARQTIRKTKFLMKCRKGNI